MTVDEPITAATMPAKMADWTLEDVQAAQRAGAILCEAIGTVGRGDLVAAEPDGQVRKAVKGDLVDGTALHDATDCCVYVLPAAIETILGD